jgi:hypothetical protein
MGVLTIARVEAPTPYRGSCHPSTTNTWLVGDDTDVVVIDPSSPTKTIIERVGSRRAVYEWE